MLCRSPEELTSLGWVEPFAGITLSYHALAAAPPSEGGDWAEAFEVSDRRLAISIGDVCGHDAAASTIMRALRDEIRAAASVSPDPAAVMRDVNDAFYRRREATYATSIFGLLDVDRRTLTFASAGHPSPFLVAQRHARFLGPPINDPPLGIVPALDVALHHVPILGGALLVFYTDGIAEFDRDWMLGQNRLRAAARTAYRSPAVRSAALIAAQLSRLARRADDASILTLRMAHSA
jgi:phosphoserine phosphatase RsbU/P